MADKVFDSDFLKKLDHMAIHVRMMMNSGAGGNRKSRSKGSSVEFSDFREYVPGDDFRRIDWNAYGRFDRLFVKLFMEERESMVNLFLDSSRSMAFGEPPKSLTAARMAGVIAYLALNNLDRVCVNILSGQSVRSSEVLNGKGRFDRCIRFLEEMEWKGAVDMNSGIKKKALSSSGISVILSDFFVSGGIEEAVKYLLYKKQEVVLLHILSPQELQPELSGQVRLLDSETREVRDVAVTPSLLRQYEKELSHFKGRLREYAAKMGAVYVQISSAEPLEKVVFEDLTEIGFIR